MLAHLLKSSIKYLLLPAIIIVMCLLSAAIPGCANAPKNTITPDRLPASVADDAVAIKNLTDSVLLALSLRDYQTLQGFVPPEDERSGQYVAEIYLGNAINTAVLEKWNAQATIVRFSNDGQTAWTAIPVSYRRHPSKPVETTSFRFKFQRCSTEHQWCLLLP